MSLSGDMSLQNLKINDLENSPLIHLPLYSIRQAEINITERTVTVNEVYSKDGSVFVKRLEDGAVNLEPQLPRLAEKIEEAAERKEEEPWKVLVKKLAYDNFAVSFEDRVPADPVNLAAEEIQLKGENISTEKGRQGSLSCSFKILGNCFISHK